MRELTAGDADILIQAVDISINSRRGNPAAYLEYLEGVLTGERVLAEFRNSCARRQRIEGGSVTWMAVLEAWRAAHCAGLTVIALAPNAAFLNAAFGLCWANAGQVGWPERSARGSP